MTSKTKQQGFKSSKVVWAAALLCACLSGFSANAVEIGESEIGINLDFTYASQYMWKGYDIYDGHGGFQPSFTIDYEGFYVGVWGSWADSAGYTDLDEIDFYGGYARSFFEEEWYAVDADLFYTYYAFPKTNSDGDAQEIALALSFPNMIPLGPSSLVPYYEVAYDWAGVQGSSYVDNGFFNTFGLSYDIPIPSLIPGQEEQAITLSWDVTYNDGAYESNPGWSHATLGASTTFEWNNFYLTPAVYYQSSFEDSVNDEDEIYAMIGIGYSF